LAKRGQIDTEITCRLEKPTYEDWTYHTTLYVDTKDYSGVDLDFVPNANMKTNLDIDLVKPLSSSRYKYRFWSAKNLKNPELMVVLTSDEFVNENFSADPKSFLAPNLINPSELDSKLHGFYVLTQTQIWTIKDCQNVPDQKFTSLSDILSHCNYAYSPCHCEDNLPTTTERCGDVSKCVVDEEHKGGWHCEACSSPNWTGDHCDKSVVLYGVVSIAFISLTSIIGALMAPFQKSQFYQYAQDFMIAIAVGCLTGDAIFHLVPTIFELNHSHGEEEEFHFEYEVILDNHDHGDHDHHHDHDHVDHHHDHDHDDHGHDHDHEHGHEDHGLSEKEVLSTGTMILAGLYIFYLLETVMIFYQARKNVNARRQNSQSETTSLHQSDEILEENPVDHGHSHAHGEIASVGWMVVIGDAFHNFADGLAIGAAFLSSFPMGLGVVFAVFFHELPHELGDFAVLLSSGMSVKQAIFWNLVSSFTCFLGFFGGIYLATSEKIQRMILAYAAGAFLYISLVGMLPLIQKQHQSWGRFFCQQAGLISGALIMYLIAIYTDEMVHIFD